MINADWVQLNCRVQPLFISHCKLDFDDQGKAIPAPAVITERKETNQVPFHRDYKVKKQSIRTALADSVYYVYYNTTKIAEVLTDINNELVDEMTVFVRFDNKFLYGEHLYDRVVKFLADNSLLFHNWTRFDIACDFNYMLDKRGRKSLDPHDFIKRFLSGRYKLLNKRKGKKRKCGMWFESGDDGLNYQTLYLGSPTSSIRTKLYNKTSEMRDKEDKPHIREQWQLNGDIDIQKDVWRCEFSIMDFRSIAIDDDEIKFSLRTLEILKDENLQTLWNILREHYFVFYEPGKTKDTNATRAAKQTALKLFDYQETGMKLKDLSKKENTTRSTKIFIKKLLETQRVIRANSEMQKLAFVTDFVAAHLVAKHDLNEWAKSRFPEWQVDNYVEPPVIDIPVVQYSMFPDGSMKAQKHKHTLSM